MYFVCSVQVNISKAKLGIIELESILIVKTADVYGD